MKLFTSVGKKFISLDACSILTVYKGVVDVHGRAATHAMTRDTAVTLITAANTHFLSIFQHLFPFSISDIQIDSG